MLKCYYCHNKLNQIELAFFNNFIAYNKQIAVAICEQCSYKQTLKELKGVKTK